jgi:hypothetical protein
VIYNPPDPVAGAELSGRLATSVLSPMQLSGASKQSHGISRLDDYLQQGLLTLCNMHTGGS